ncbi:HD domain-containing protein [Candidatus Desulfovibrio trichonymphae]|uniref:HD superfamily hydrolase n=1 Tax=Candidatus Desulfovibrio trichonymphae TaxID=1725232 RepID=A0A1J1DVK1_9BACT|nr:HD domain-containing protein [Candidatus Desulfovibrio trichonymphae]BAV91892.1 HD superfamily hydrolase [Candidatus Desulfovibrio trichonymphae]GHU95843.1 phosphohydrolase [Deltaproteobacteria bacterium]GHU98983.1 phosphohydrolase [Deltaproteobacteria bacterium]
MSIVRKSLLQLIFSGAYLLRWNDKLRPSELLEIDKQAHKMLVACALWHENGRGLPDSERLRLARDVIEGGLFDYFYRLIITDIKPPVFYRIKENPDHFRRLTEHVLSRLEPLLSPLGPFWERMSAWHLEGDETTLSRRILSAAHLFASRWEFNLIKPLNTFDDEMDDIALSFEERLDAFRDLAGMEYLLAPGNALAKLANHCGQLRFQIRWTQAPRIPATSVLGHMFIVAAFSYFFSLAVGACTARANNNFFCGLFHDLPELLTRDIISPVKQSVACLPALLKEYEEEELTRRIFHPLREEGFALLVEQISYYLGLEAGSEFQESAQEGGRVVRVDGFDALQKGYNADALNPKDGQMIKVCDLLAAFLEAHSSIRNGVSSPKLQDALARLKERLYGCPLDCLHLGSLLADFD